MLAADANFSTFLFACSVAMVQAVSFQRKSLSYMLLLNPGNLFSVNQESGALGLTRTVDYESGHNLHTLQVRASEPDSGLSSVAEVRSCDGTQHKRIPSLALMLQKMESQAF